MDRRRFLGATAAAAAPLSLKAAEKPALLGGKPVRSAEFPDWPRFDSTEEKELLRVLRSGKWFRGWGENVDRFEAAYARTLGAKHCIATASGTSALIAALGTLGVGPGDEVILPPYTFVACVNAILMFGALPVFVDSDRRTFQIDARKIENAISEYTVAIMPVHLGGNAADLDTILSVARKHKLPVIEDACQAHFAEWRGRKVSTFGDFGCFSFQASKNLNSGEGGAVMTSDDSLADRCFRFHNNSHASRRRSSSELAYSGRGANLRMTEFQAALLMAQLSRLEEQSRTREKNAEYLSSLLREIPGILPAEKYEGCTRNAYHLYMFRYDREKFAGLPRGKFLKAVAAEGIPASGGYSPLNKDPLIKATLTSRGFSRIYSKERLAAWEERTRCPENDRLCSEAVWLSQNMLLGSRTDMEQIAGAIRRVQSWAADLARG